MSITNSGVRPTNAADHVYDVLIKKLRSISGVRVSARVSRPLGQRIVEVAVPDGDTAAEMAVYRAELETYQQFPDARIELYLV